MDRPAEGSPVMRIALNEAALGISAFEVSRRLRSGDPAVFVQEKALPQGVLTIHPLNLDGRRTEALAAALRRVLSGQRPGGA